MILDIIDLNQGKRRNITHSIYICIISLLLISFDSSSQDLLFTDDPKVNDAFRSTTVVNAQTTQIPPKEGWQFHIRHRFGAVKMDNSMIKNFLGADLVANIQFSGVFPVSDKMFIGVGRTKFGKNYNIEVKRLILSQTTDNKMPVSIAVYADVSCMSDAFPPVPKNSYFGDGVTAFEYTFRHRLTYNSQLLISRKFGELLSVELNPVFIYRNLVAPGKDNHTFNLTTAFSIRTSKNSSILAEYAYRFNNEPINGNYPLSLGMEFGTVGHTFQIVISSARDLQEQAIYSSETTDYQKGELLFGFNIKRTFWYKKKKKHDVSTQ
jgi:hypothetical protein